MAVAWSRDFRRYVRLCLYSLPSLLHGDAMKKQRVPRLSHRAAKPVRGSLSPRARKLALARFSRRAADLVLGYVAAGRSTPKLSRAVRRLKDDINSWGDRWGRKD